MRKYSVGIAGLCCFALLLIACGRTADKALDQALFALDAGDYATARSAIESEFGASPSDFSAAMVLSAARAGLAGVDLFDLAKRLTDAANETKAFDIIHDNLVELLCAGGCATGLDHLRDSIDILAALPAASIPDARENEYRFQLGILQTVEAFGLASITAQPTKMGTITVANIQDAAAPNDHLARTQNDFIAADGNLIAADISSSNQIISTIRKQYCVLKVQSAASGFTLAELRDRVQCELDGLPHVGDLSAVANCAAFNFDAANVTTCAADNTTE
ncbi:MAG: hypothetical protein HYV03_05640 [Deltaproteobacteria bacterium]|nr:hypothetical protein [Deltaproteobacteria bacterium]